MKIFISADIEGITGTTHWDEVTRTHPDYPEFQEQITREVASACKAALDAGATDILVRDAHSTARNIRAADLPEPARLVRGWSRHPYMMMQELDSSFDAVLMIGYHSMAGSTDNPLAHTLYSDRIAEIRINDRPVSEFGVNARTASLESVPVVFISGDKGVCQEAVSLIPGIRTVAVKKGIGSSTINMHPDQACKKIYNGVKAALSARPFPAGPSLAKKIRLDIRFIDHTIAYRAGYYPGVTSREDGWISFETSDYFNVLRLLLFI
ncbi:MAG: amino acid amidase [Desulfobacteraceae bacterium]|nr:MAG: amino acid amidase [Desulfobacteraceae bacterium]